MALKVMLFNGSLKALAIHVDPPRIAKSEETETFEAAGQKEKIDNLVIARNAARAAKDFKESDRIRDELLAKGIVLKDGPTGTTWEVKR